MLANGTPMFCAGDEFLNTQRGNNNPYNQDNETTWLDWSLLEKHRDIFRFFQRMIAFRKSRTRPSPAAATGGRRALARRERPGGLRAGVAVSGVLFAWDACEGDLYVMINAFWQPVLFHIQQPGAWNRVVDTSRQDLATQAVDGLNYEVAPRSVVVLERA